MDRGGHTDTTHTYKSVANGDMRSSRFIGFGEELDLVGEKAWLTGSGIEGHGAAASRVLMSMRTKELGPS